MLGSAFSLAILTVASFSIVYHKLPRKMRKLIEKHDLIADICALLATYWFLGGTLTALMAGAIVGLITSGLLHIAKNPNDFLYIFHFKEEIKKHLKAAKESLNKYGAQYREQLITEGVVVDSN